MDVEDASPGCVGNAVEIAADADLTMPSRVNNLKAQLYEAVSMSGGPSRFALAL